MATSQMPRTNSFEDDEKLGSTEQVEDVSFPFSLFDSLILKLILYPRSKQVSLPHLEAKINPAAEKRLVRKLDFVILPQITLLFLLNFIDRCVLSVSFMRGQGNAHRLLPSSLQLQHRKRLCSRISEGYRAQRTEIRIQRSVDALLRRVCRR